MRIDRASHVVEGAPATIYRALLEPAELARWLPPQGMHAYVELLEACAGGRYRMTMRYDDAEARGKSAANEDVVHGHYRELLPDQRIVQEVEFDSEAPEFAGTMTMTWNLTPKDAQHTEVSITCENVPAGIRPEDHETGLRASLANLAAYIAGQAPS